MKITACSMLAIFCSTLCLADEIPAPPATTVDRVLPPPAAAPAAPPTPVETVLPATAAPAPVLAVKPPEPPPMTQARHDQLLQSASRMRKGGIAVIVTGGLLLVATWVATGLLIARSYDIKDLGDAGHFVAYTVFAEYTGVFGSMASLAVIGGGIELISCARARERTARSFPVRGKADLGRRFSFAPTPIPGGAALTLQLSF